MEMLTKDKIKELFEEKGYYISDYLLAKTCLGLEYLMKGESVGQEVFSMCLDGPSGAGKTFFVETYSQIASKLLGVSVQFINFQLDAETGKSDLYEDIDVVATFEGDTTKIRIPGKIIEAFKAVNEGKYVILKMDEYDKARSVTDTFFNNCLQEGRINTIQHGDVEISKENRGRLQVFLCKNNVRGELSEPMMRRNRMARVDYMNSENLYQVLSAFVIKHGCDSGLLNFVSLIYKYIYKNRANYRKLPSCSECEQAIMDAHLLVKIGGFSNHDIYTNIIEDMLKLEDDIKTFTAQLKNAQLEEDEKLANLIESMNDVDSTSENMDLNHFIAETIFTDEAQKLIAKTSEIQQLIDEYKVKFAQMEEERKKAIEEEIQKISLQNGTLVTTTMPHAVSNFEDESSHVKRGFNIFEISHQNWVDVAEFQIPGLSHHYLIDKLVEYASDLDIKIYENGILIREDGEQKLIVIRDLDEDHKLRYRMMSNYPVIPSTYLTDVSSFMNFSFQAFSNQPATGQSLVKEATQTPQGSYTISSLVYNDSVLPFETVAENIYHIETAGTIEEASLQTIFGGTEFSCDNIPNVIEISKKIMGEKKLVKTHE